MKLVRSFAPALLALALAAPARAQDPTPAEPKKEEPAKPDAPKPEEKPSDGGDKKATHKSIALDTPGEWRAEKAKGPKVLKAAFRLEQVEGDKEPAHATLWFFGEKGSLDKSVNAFAKMFGATADKVKKDPLEIGGLKATLCEVSGSFTEQQGKKKDKGGDPRPGYKLVAAVIEGPDGSWVARLVGPEKTVEKNRDTFMKWVKSAHAADRADEDDAKGGKKKKDDAGKGGDEKKGDDKKDDDKKEGSMGGEK